MLRRDLLPMLALTAVGGFVFPTWLLAEAEKLEVTKTDEEWARMRLSGSSGTSTLHPK